jgi:hypothetical protein
MTISSSFEIAIRSEDRPLFLKAVDALEIPLLVSELLPIRAEEPFAVSVRRTAGDVGRLRVRLGNEIIAEVPPRSASGETPLEAWLRNEFGDSRVVVEREVEAAADHFEVLFEIGLAVAPRPEIARDFRVMIEDVAVIHQGLAHDVLGRGMHRGSFSADSVSLLHPEVMLRALAGLSQRFERVLAQIARQPSVTLNRSTQLAHYRGGDRCDARAVATAVRDPAARVRTDGRIAALGKVAVRSVVVSEDLPEHRHIAEGLRRLAARAEILARHCRRSADLLRIEEEHWGTRREGSRSVFEQRDLPRIQALEELAAAGRRVAGELQQLLQQHQFLAEAGSPRTRFGPTPAFLGRSAYRQAYRLLVEAKQLLGVLVDGEAARLYYRNLATLYEYWCFLRTVAYLRERLGPSQARQTFSLIDEIYRPELAPGQEFRFTLDNGAHVAAIYQPEIRPWKEATARGERYGATLTTQSLRPDILLSLERPDGPARMMVLDAKSTDVFYPMKLRELTDYARQVLEPSTGRQPIREVFLLHRDRASWPLANLPGYFKGRSVEADAHILGAVPCVPERAGSTPEGLALLLDGFLAR